MSNRLDQERETRLQLKRLQHAKEQIEGLGLGLKVIHEESTSFVFWFKGSLVRFYPYSGWHTGKTVKDGRGLKNLLDQLKP